MNDREGMTPHSDFLENEVARKDGGSPLSVRDKVKKWGGKEEYLQRQIREEKLTQLHKCNTPAMQAMTRR